MKLKKIHDPILNGVEICVTTTADSHIWINGSPKEKLENGGK